MNDIFLANIKALEERDSSLASAIKASVVAGIEIELAKNGQKTFKYNGAYFHSSYDPLKEADRQARDVTDKGWDFPMFFGLGLGYLIRAYIKSTGGQLIVYEPSNELLRFAFESVDLTDILKNEEVFITNDLWMVGSIIKARALPIDTVGIYTTPPYKKNFPDEFDSYTHAVTNAQGVNRGNLQTEVASNEIWFENFLKNLPHLVKLPPLDILSDNFKGIPLVIVGAGPSLDKNIHLLKKIKGKALIIAALTAYKPLLEIGLYPDFVIAMEKIDISEYFTDTEQDKEIRLLLGDLSHPSMFTDRQVKNTFVYFSSFLGKGAKLNALMGNTFQPITGGSVTTVALDIGRYLACDPIVFVGQDHAYGAGGSHVKASVYGEQSMQLNKDGLVTLAVSYPGYDEPIVQDHAVRWLKGIDGEKVMSRFDWVNFHQWIVDYMKYHNNSGSSIKMINSTQGGAYIDGMAHMPLAETIEKYIDTIEGKESVEEILCRVEKAFRPVDIKPVIKELKEILAGYRLVLKLSNDSNKRISRIMKRYEKSAKMTQSQKDLTAFVKYEKRLLEVSDTLYFLKTLAAKAAYDLQRHIKEDVASSNAQDQLVKDMGATRKKNEFLIELCRHFIELFVELINELDDKKSREA